MPRAKIFQPNSGWFYGHDLSTENFHVNAIPKSSELEIQNLYIEWYYQTWHSKPKSIQHEIKIWRCLLTDDFLPKELTFWPRNFATNKQKHLQSLDQVKWNNTNHSIISRKYHNNFDKLQCLRIRPKVISLIDQIMVFIWNHSWFAHKDLVSCEIMAVRLSSKTGIPPRSREIWNQVFQLWYSNMTSWKTKSNSIFHRKFRL